jgi:hypothetical protein
MVSCPGEYDQGIDFITRGFEKMKKLLVMIAVLCLPLVGSTGCGGGSGENQVVGDGPSEPAMTSSQMSDYEEQMRSGAASSAPE